MISISAIKSFLRKSLNALPLMNENALVFGSGPGSSIPNTFGENWSLVTINASQAAVPDNSIVPDFTLIGTSTLRNKPANREAKQALRGRRTRTLILFDRERFIDNQRLKLLILGYSYDRVIFLSTAERSKWIHEATGSSLTDKPSNGVAAAFLCASVGVKNIVMTGFSLTKEGHAYNHQNRERAHVVGDRKALRMAIARNIPLSTNQADFSIESGVPLLTVEFGQTEPSLNSQA